MQCFSCNHEANVCNECLDTLIKIKLDPIKSILKEIISQVMKHPDDCGLKTHRYDAFCTCNLSCRGSTVHDRSSIDKELVKKINAL